MSEIAEKAEKKEFYLEVYLVVGGNEESSEKIGKIFLGSEDGDRFFGIYSDLQHAIKEIGEYTKKYESDRSTFSIYRLNERCRAMKMKDIHPYEYIVSI